MKEKELKLRPWQVDHCQHLLSTLVKTKSVLDASETGTGKTACSLWVMKQMGIVPLVVGPRFARGTWEKASEDFGVPLEFVNYEKLRGQRKRETGLVSTDYLEEVKWGSGSFLKWKIPYHTIIFDEIARCGGATSLNSKALIAAKRQCEYVYCISATCVDDPKQMKGLGFALGLHGLSKKTRVMPDWMGWMLRHGVSPGTFGGFATSSDPEKLKKAFTRLHHEIFPAHGARMIKSEIPGFPATQISNLYLADDEEGTAANLCRKLHELGKRPSDLAERIALRQKLELLKVPFLVDAAKEYITSSKLVFFVNFTETLELLRDELSKVFGPDKVGFISGTQMGLAGEAQRKNFLELFQQNKLDALVCNSQAGGESASMHDPTGAVERTAFISPLESGRQFKQVLGRVHRDGGAKSQQFLVGFEKTFEEVLMDNLAQKNYNLDLFNDADLMI